MAVDLFDATTRPWLPPRLERKFYIAPHKVEATYGLLRVLCRPDLVYPAEQINSLYFDTFGFDQYERSLAGDFVKNKVRLRWYGTDNELNMLQPVFVELKSRKGFASTKQRLELRVPVEKLSPAYIHEGIIPKTLLGSTLARFGYFPLEPLYPIIKISYWRYRFREVLTGIRVALDCHVRSTMISANAGNGERELELPGTILEIKGESMDIPASLKQLKLLGINWSRFSKYSACIDSHSERLGAIGRLSPSGLNIDEIPTTLNRQNTTYRKGLSVNSAGREQLVINRLHQV
jgi:hypothetical protein